MNCPAKTEPIVPDGHNQNPNDLSSDLTTRSDLGKLANARLQREHRLRDPQEPSDAEIIPEATVGEVEEKDIATSVEGEDGTHRSEQVPGEPMTHDRGAIPLTADEEPKVPFWKRWTRNTFQVLKTYFKFVGPGFMISVVSSPNITVKCFPSCG